MLIKEIYDHVKNAPEGHIFKPRNCRECPVAQITGKEVSYATPLYTENWEFIRWFDVLDEEYAIAGFPTNRYRDITRERLLEAMETKYGSQLS